MSEVYSKLEAAAKKRYTSTNIFMELKTSQRALADESKLHFILKSEDATLLNSVQLEDFSVIYQVS